MSRTVDGSPTSSGPIRPNRTIRPAMLRPTPSFNVIGGTLRRVAATGDPVSVGVCGPSVVMAIRFTSFLEPGPGTGINDPVQQVDEQIRTEDCERDDQEHALHQRVVVVV